MLLSLCYAVEDEMLKDTDISRAGARQFAQKPGSLAAHCGSPVLPGAVFCFVCFMLFAQAIKPIAVRFGARVKAAEDSSAPRWFLMPAL
jgi:hypothetical protein